MSQQFAVYVNTAAGEGFVGVVDSYEIVPSEGHSTLQGIFNSREEAEDILRQCLFEPIVAVFEDTAAGKSYYTVDPTGNWRGSGEYPYTLVGEYAYDPKVPGDRERAIKEADEEVRRLKTRS